MFKKFSPPLPSPLRYCVPMLYAWLIGFAFISRVSFPLMLFFYVLFQLADTPPYRSILSVLLKAYLSDRLSPKILYLVVLCLYV